ncbi:MAG: hypothetical protein M1838_005412 [Thelocarpon superellum]|nr:MAG: hypothetical protein M1838_005412 [Thelocarpon superellum]
MSLPAEVEASYTAIIDSILAKSDLNTVSAKRIRKGLQAVAQIKDLIMARFDKFNAEKNQTTPSLSHESASEALANGHDTKSDESEPVQQASPPESGIKRQDSDPEAMSDVIDVPVKPKTKKRKVEEEEDDAIIAARLQAEEYTRARSTRGGATKKTGPIRKKKKKVSVTSLPRLKGDDDSDLESGSGAEKKRKVNRSGGFHKPLTLSTPLSAFMDGEAQLPRTEVVKRIWSYVKERDLQDPNDRRQIRCDDPLKAIFKQERVHMFTMNKLLSGHMFAPGE